MVEYGGTKKNKHMGDVIRFPSGGSRPSEKSKVPECLRLRARTAAWAQDAYAEAVHETGGQRQALLLRLENDEVSRATVARIAALREHVQRLTVA